MTTSDAQKPGAPCGNRNRLRHGVYARQSLVLGRPGPGMAYAAAGARAFMRDVHAAVLAAHGSVGLFQESVILEVGEHEVSRRLLWRLLRTPGLTPDQQAQFRRDASKAASERTRCLKALGLDKRKTAGSAWDALHAVQTHPPDVPPIQVSSDAPAVQPGSPTGGDP